MRKQLKYSKLFVILIEILKDGEQCACKLLEQLNIGQPTLSHHMKILCDSGIINRVKYGKWTHYSINKEKLEDIKGIIDSMI